MSKNNDLFDVFLAETIRRVSPRKFYKKKLEVIFCDVCFCKKKCGGLKLSLMRLMYYGNL